MAAWVEGGRRRCAVLGKRRLTRQRRVAGPSGRATRAGAGSRAGASAILPRNGNPARARPSAAPARGSPNRAAFFAPASCRGLPARDTDAALRLACGAAAPGGRRSEQRRGLARASSYSGAVSERCGGDGRHSRTRCRFCCHPGCHDCHGCHGCHGRHSCHSCHGCYSCHLCYLRTCWGSFLQRRCAASSHPTGNGRARPAGGAAGGGAALRGIRCCTIGDGSANVCSDGSNDIDSGGSGCGRAGFPAAHVEALTLPSHTAAARASAAGRRCCFRSRRALSFSRPARARTSPTAACGRPCRGAVIRRLLP